MLRITLSYGNAKRLRELSIRYSDRDWDHINAKPWQPRTWISLNIISNHRRDQICIYTLKHILLQVIRFLHHYRHGHSDHSRRHGRSDHSRRHEHSDQKKKKPQQNCFYWGFSWCHRESNQGHKDFQSFALPTELWHHFYFWTSVLFVWDCKGRHFFITSKLFCKNFSKKCTFFIFCWISSIKQASSHTPNWHITIYPSAH